MLRSTLNRPNAAAVVLALLVVSGPAAAAPRCGPAGQWLIPGEDTRQATDQVVALAAGRRIVLLGEHHDNVEHHRWQLYTLAALHGRRSDMVVGFEMFPRAVQPALDRWRRGELDDKAFLAESRWTEVWGFPPALYLPLFHFVRQNRLPMVALNVDHSLVSEVGEKGWAAIPVERREGVGDPAPASDAYRRSLAEVFLKHGGDPEAADEDSGDQEAGRSLEEVMGQDDFRNFVAAQLTWDRAMAEALATAARGAPSSLVVGIIGSGHLHHRWGVAHQLRDLGFDTEDVGVLLPVETMRPCEDFAAGLADAVFLLGERPGDRPSSPGAADRPKLGVLIEPAERGVRVSRVVPDSVAASTGILADDVIVAAAGATITATADLVTVVQRQAPGTWLPLTVVRAGETLELVAKFPASAGRQR